MKTLMFPTLFVVCTLGFMGYGCGQQPQPTNAATDESVEHPADPVDNGQDDQKIDDATADEPAPPTPQEGQPY